MKCNICGREYIALGVHLRHKHKINPAEYKEEFNMLQATPLVDSWLSERMQMHAHARLKDPEYKAEAIARCKKNAVKNLNGNGSRMTKAGKEAIAKSDKIRNQKYLEKQSAVIAKVLQEKGTMRDVTKATGTGAIAGKKMAELAGIVYSRESAKIIRDKRAAATIRAKAVARVAKVMPYLTTTKSITEMCRLGGISIRTYKNWRASDLIPAHPNSKTYK